MILERKKRHLERYIEIGGILAKHGWQNLLYRTGLADTFLMRRQRTGVPPQPVQVREALEELGPAFIKFGQLLSTRADIVPLEYIAELEKLQDAAPPVAFSDVRRILESELSGSIESLFAEFDQKPLASASLGQTHLAALSDGRPVVVKVQRPGIRQVIENDLEIIAGIARLLEQRFERTRVYKLSELVDEFSITIMQELDYTREGRNGEALKDNLAKCDFVRVAETIWEYTTPRVLTSERLCGIKITDIQELDARGYDRKVVASNLSKAFLKMVFEDGFFHGDPHPGNLVVLENNVVGLLDYGIVGRLQHDLKSQITMLFANYIREDSTGFSKVLFSMGTWPGDLDRRAFEIDIDRLLRQYYGAPVRELNMGEVLSGALRISARYRVSLPPSLALLVKVILGVEGIDNRLYPEYDLAGEARPYIMNSVRGEFSIFQLRDDLLENLLSWKSLLLHLPSHLSDVLDHMAENSFRINFKHEGLEGPFMEIDKSANRLSFALISSATIIGSSLILSAEVGPVWRGYPLLGVIGFGISFIFAVWLMISIIRAGRLW